MDYALALKPLNYLRDENASGNTEQDRRSRLINRVPDYDNFVHTDQQVNSLGCNSLGGKAIRSVITGII